MRAGEIVGEGWHHRAGLEHAEVLAIEQAGARARGGTIYCSLEPCCHRGRTPPCAEAVLKAGIVRVVLTLEDPDPQVSGRGVEVLRRGGVAVDFLEGEIRRRSERVIEDYLVHRREARAFAAMKVAATLDGRIADRRGHSSWVTGDAARAHGRDLRNLYGAILVGAETVRADDPLLRPPGDVGDGPSFHRCVLSRRLDLPPSARLFRDHDAACPVSIYTTSEAPPQGIAAFEAMGISVVVCDAGASASSIPRHILTDLASRGVLGVLIEGGGKTHGAFLDEALVDRIYWYTAPRLLADEHARSATLIPAERSLSDTLDFDIDHLTMLGDDLLLELLPKTHPARAR